jgi:general stress protein 26
MASTPEEFARVRSMIERMKVGMLTTQDSDGSLRSRPLHTLEADLDGRLWFFVSASSPKIEELQREHGKVALAYADPGRQDYLSVSGRGELSRDRERMKKLWSPWVKVWFPQGLEDPDLALLCVHIEQAEYWDAPGSAVQRAYGLAKARMTGDKDAIGENRKVRLA